MNCTTGCRPARQQGTTPIGLGRPGALHACGRPAGWLAGSRDQLAPPRGRSIDCMGCACAVTTGGVDGKDDQLVHQSLQAAPTRRTEVYSPPPQLGAAPYLSGTTTRPLPGTGLEPLPPQVPIPLLRETCTHEKTPWTSSRSPDVAPSRVA